MADSSEQLVDALGAALPPLLTALGDLGAKVTYREIADLSHTYPSSEEHAQIYDWFMGGKIN